MFDCETRILQLYILLILGFSQATVLPWNSERTAIKFLYHVDLDLRENGILKTGVKNKADIFNRQFVSVYTREQAGDSSSKGPSPYPDIGDLFTDPIHLLIDPNGVRKLLDRLNPHKSSGPDDLSARVLKECSAEISPVLACIFNQSLAQDRVPEDWL